MSPLLGCNDLAAACSLCNRNTHTKRDPSVSSSFFCMSPHFLFSFSLSQNAHICFKRLFSKVLRPHAIDVHRNSSCLTISWNRMIRLFFEEQTADLWHKITHLESYTVNIGQWLIRIRTTHETKKKSRQNFNKTKKSLFFSKLKMLIVRNKKVVILKEQRWQKIVRRRNED